MFENVLALLERGVVALEQIAANGARPSWVKDGCGCAPKAVAETPDDTYVHQEVIDEPAVGDIYYPENERPEVAEMAEADAAQKEREFLKFELRRKGIKFKDSARTETLKKLLDSAVLPEKEVVVEDHIADAGKMISKDDVRNALVQLSAGKGKDAALTILKSIGGADKLGDVPEDKYAAIVEACHGA